MIKIDNSGNYYLTKDDWLFKANDVEAKHAHIIVNRYRHPRLRPRTILYFNLSMITACPESGGDTLFNSAALIVPKQHPNTTDRPHAPYLIYVYDKKQGGWVMRGWLCENNHSCEIVEGTAYAENR